MPQSESLYRAFAELLVSQSQTQPVSPAELQGLLIGRCCAGADFKLETWLEDAQILFGAVVPSTLHAALSGLQEMLETEMSGDDTLTVTLLLPDDKAPITERVQALGQWCQGFLNGFGSYIGAQKFSEEVREMLEDLVAIAQIEQQTETPPTEADEFDFMEVTEYLRVVPMFIYTECAATSAARLREAADKPVH